MLGLALALVAVTGCGVSRDLDRADALAAEGRWTEAAELYKQVLRDYPHSYRAGWGMARIYCLERNMPRQCLEWTEPLLAAYPDEQTYRDARAAGLRLRAADLRAEGDTAAAEAAEAEANRLQGR